MDETLEARCRAILQTDAAREAIEFDGQWYSWGEVSDVANRVAGLLAQVPARAPIAFVPRNRPSAIAAELGMAAAGRTIVMIYAFQSSAGISRDVGRLDVAAVIAAEDDFTPELEAVVREKGLVAVAISDMNARLVSGSDLPATTDFPKAPEGPEIRVHTSGTTGAPKHVGFTYDTILKYIVGQHVGQVTGGNETAAPTLLYYPLGNISGLYSTFPGLLEGKRVHLLDRFDLDAWRDHVRRYRPAMAGVPAGGIRMILDADIPKEELSSLKVMPTGAAPLDPTVQRAFEERYGIPILLSYGATEFGGPVTLMTIQDYAQFGASKLGSVGRPFAGASLRVIDPETGDAKPPGSDGLLEVMAPRIGPHFIRTTDMGMIDQDGFVYLRGRADGAIIRGGFKLLPDIIEQALCLHPAIAAAAVVGIPDERLGQLPAAAIQLKPGTSPLTVSDLEQHLRQHVYATHIPGAWTFVEAIPRNPSFKVDMAGVRALFHS